MKTTWRRKLLIAAGPLLLTPFTLIAQQLSSARRIGFLAVNSRSIPSHPDARYDAFVLGMRELGWIEGKNLIIEWRFADGVYGRVPALAAELVQMNLEVIVTHATPTTQMLQRATRSIPIVGVGFGDPVRDGIVASLARPGGNVTGLSLITGDLNPKQLELLKTIIPALSRVAVLTNPDNANSTGNLKSVEASAKALGLGALYVQARNSEEIERGFATINRERVGAVLIELDPIFYAQMRRIADLANQYRLAGTCGYHEFAQSGGLLSYGQNLSEFYRYSAVYVDKILKGAKPSELPIEQPTKFELAVNLKTARGLGIKIPSSILLRADRVIE